MLHDRYEIEASEGFTTFVFTSDVPKGAVKKVIRFTEINVKGIYNLGFGDIDPITGYVSDTVRTNNKDSIKVLATVGAALYLFMQIYPEATVIATGSTDARTRLYRIGVSNNIDAIERDFTVLGLTESGWEKVP